MGGLKPSPPSATAAEPVAQQAADYLQNELDKLDAPITYTACKKLVAGILSRALAITMHGDDVEWRGFLTKADTFAAALPVQPGAGEREAALRGEIFCLREVVRGVRILDHAGRFKEFDGEPWLRRVRNIGLDHDPVEFSRQPPQSSREDDMEHKIG